MIMSITLSFDQGFVSSEWAVCSQVRRKSKGK